ncbi:hypothetical protein EAY64_18030 [Aquitalea palustris]|uniref:DUF4124 domain-containing protein n=1 Tax=Aquitalea palustris TaxID=2480983 RepID=A0A454JDW8_9NEIS|nr:DUF4124 domain-containing protein [Aquitalea palustris]RMC92379.1 hypothetical protein EAY64_18030 [Aquitalea palustris]
MYRFLSPLICFMTPLVLQAAVFKCISPAGQHSYQDQPCPADHAAHTLRGGNFSLVTREPYQLRELQDSRQQTAKQARAMQQEQAKALQLRRRQHVQQDKHCRRLQARQQTLQRQLSLSRSPLQTQRLQSRLASLANDLHDAACPP